MTEEPRYKKIVIPLDGSGWSERAVQHALLHAEKGSEIILLHVFVPPAYEYTDQLALAGQEQQIDMMREQTKQYLLGIRNQLRSQGITVRIQMIEGSQVAHHICDYIDDEGVDLVVMSTHGRTGLARFLFGSVAQKVMQAISVPVLLVRPDKQDS
ncbi:universal stress protein [Anaerolineales bacterium]